MKVIFLDIDGVLNTSETFKKRYFKYKKTGIISLEIDEFRLKYLQELVVKTEAKIVLSSTWRMFFQKMNGIIIPLNSKAKELIVLFDKYHLNIYDITPVSETMWRETEIEEWLNNNEVDSFVILDDESKDLQKYVDNLVLVKDSKTEFNKYKNGLNKNHIKEAIEILNQEKTYKKKKLIKK